MSARTDGRGVKRSSRKLPEATTSARLVEHDGVVAHVADLHEAGHLLATGPLFDDLYRGLSILNVPWQVPQARWRSRRSASPVRWLRPWAADFAGPLEQPAAEGRGERQVTGSRPDGSTMARDVQWLS